MKDVVFSFSLAVRRKDSLAIFIIASVLFFLLILLVQNGTASRDVLSFTALPLIHRLLLALRTMFDIYHTFTIGTLVLAILWSFLGGINIALAHLYMRLRGEVILHSGLYNGIGLLFAFIGIGCAACGTAFLSIILSFFGFSAMLSLLPYEGQEIGYTGLIFLCIATYSLSRRVARSNVC
jgi:hypothetical protein